MKRVDAIKSIFDFCKELDSVFLGSKVNLIEDAIIKSLMGEIVSLKWAEYRDGAKWRLIIRVPLDPGVKEKITQYFESLEIDPPVSAVKSSGNVYEFFGAADEESF